MTPGEFREWLQETNAPMEMRKWAEGRAPQDAWRKCNNSEWMLWWLGKLGYTDAIELRIFAFWCVGQTWHLLIDRRGREAVEMVERYARGETTAEELTAANVAVCSATKWAAWNAAWDASAAARDVASDVAACDPTENIPLCAAWAAGKDARRAQADELRRRIPWPVVEELLRKQTEAVPQ